jgi:sec-independent protein translocase protein TatB
MFGMGASEILVILVVALLFLGPEKLPEAAQKISKGIRDLRKQTRELQNTIENDSQIGGAIRDLKSALRGDEPRPTRLQPRKEPPGVPAPDPDAVPPPVPAITQPPAAGEAEAPAEAPAGAAAEAEADDEVAMIRPAAGTVAKGASES